MDTFTVRIVSEGDAVARLDKQARSTAAGRTRRRPQGASYFDQMRLVTSGQTWRTLSVCPSGRQALLERCGPRLRTQTRLTGY